MPNADANCPCSLPQERQFLPAARTLSWVVNYLICMALWSIRRAIFRVALNFLPALRERRALSRGRATPMMQLLRVYLAAGGLLVTLCAPGTPFAQKPGGILQMPDFSSPASMSMHEESTITAGTPVMPVFNNL